MDHLAGKLQLFLFLLSTLILGSLAHSHSDNERKAYIVYMGDAPEATIAAADQHLDLLSNAIGDGDIARQSRMHSYGKSFNGFAAMLLPEEAKTLQEHENVVSVFPSTLRKLHTTRSWDFLRMPLSAKRNTQKESDIIVGLLDTGIYTDAPSFNDDGFGPPPSKWKGVCQLGANFTHCNNKVIGARVYSNDPQHPHPNPSPADFEGHGTHTASTVAGIPVAGASLYGLGQGTARGGVPSARIAVYKVCWDEGCSDMNILSAFDDAIHDGVDLLSISIGGSPSDYFTNVMAIGSFHAMKKGILTTCSAGNSGPSMYTVENVAPWIMTVAASGLDRQFRTQVGIGDGMNYSGISVNTFNPQKQMYPLISGAKAVNETGVQEGLSPLTCDWGSLDENKIKGKIVLCQAGMGTDYTIKELGGVGTIISTDDHSDTGFTSLIPNSQVNTLDGEKIDKYINSTKDPQAIIFKSRTVNVTAPFVASFSSRGPNVVSPTILKPDITAPGVDILAAFSKLVSVTGLVLDNRYDVYNIISGTSMACPHAAATVAYIKSFHPDWSPAAIKSAIMTTASEMKVRDETAELAYGAGQIDPIKALEPGLIYDISTIDYIRFLCKEGYSGTPLHLVTDEYKNCSSIPPFGGHDALNYPSMHLYVDNHNSSFSATFERTVTNVGAAESVYKATVKAPKGLTITVLPDTLTFNKVHEKRSFKVELKGPPLKNVTFLSASLEWRDSKHRVKSPILILAPEV